MNTTSRPFESDSFGGIQDEDSKAGEDSAVKECETSSVSVIVVMSILMTLELKQAGNGSQSSRLS